MATRTNHPVQCGCGHSGTIRQVESDQPYSAIYETYSPVDLKGASIELSRMADWTEILELMALRCPTCGVELSERHILKQP